MNIRAFELYDEIRVRDIHEKYFKDEFSFPDFFNKFLLAFVVEDDDKNIISVGGVRTILESVIITDKSFTPQMRMAAFEDMLGASAFAGRKHGYDQLHAFIQDEKWSKRLQKSFNFRPTKGQSLILDI